MSPKSLFSVSPVIPVIVIENADHAIPLAKTLLDNGVGIMEITLRSDAAFESIKRIATEVPDMHVGAGTVICPEQMHLVKEAGASFCFSPGISIDLIQTSQELNLPFIPGVATASEIMLALNSELTHCKLFPAEAIGGIDLLKSLAGPFPDIMFCPTGGINQTNMLDYLKLKNVPCVGSSAIAPADLIRDAAFDEIALRCQTSIKRIEQA